MPGLFALQTDAALVGIDAGLLDDRRPFVDLGFQVRAQRLRCGAFLGHRLGAEIGEALFTDLILECRLQRFGQGIDDRLGRALRRIECRATP